MNIPLDEYSTIDLVNIALSSDDDDPGYWDAVWALCRRATSDVFQTAQSLCQSDCPIEQRLGCDVLAQLGAPENPCATAAFPIVAAVVTTTDNPGVLNTGVCALGWLKDPRGVDVILPLLHHADAQVRYAVTLGLTALADDLRCID